MAFIGFLILCAIPVVAYYLKFGFKAWLPVTAIVAPLGAIAIYSGYGLTLTHDTETLNGYVTSKEVKQRDCKYPGWYDYSDSFCTNENTRRVFSHYRRVCDGNGKNCHQEAVYKTQYSYDYPWERKYYVFSTLETYKIDRVDRQGKDTPPRYASVNNGDPVAVTSSYRNYLKVAGANILNPESMAAPVEILNAVPQYPQNVYDYYRMDRLVLIGASVDANAWNKRIELLNSRVGPQKQGNLIVVVTTVQDRDIRAAIYRKWGGGKKNDIILILSVAEGTVKWVDGITFLNNKGNEFMVSDFNSLSNKPLSVAMLDDVEKIILARFDRTAMKSVEYLKDSYSPPVAVFIWSALFALVLTIGSLYFYWRNQQ